MQAIEFETVSKDGTIKIPDQYKEFISKPLKVILLKADETLIPGSEIIDEFFDGINIDLTGYKFNRDEANER